MTWKSTNTAKGDNKLYSDAKGVVPSLDLRFAEGKTLNDYMTGQNLITFSRPVGTNQSPGTYVDENGIIQLSSANQPRFDHDPTTGESLGLLVEESRTNLLRYSEHFDNAVWAQGGAAAMTVVSNATVAPDGTITADKFIRNAGATSGGRQQLITPPSVGGVFSVFAKAGEISTFNLQPSSSSAFQVTFDVSTGTASSPGASVTGYGIEEHQNGWYRCWVRAVLSSAYIAIETVAPATGDGTSGIYIWGAQLEAGSFPTSYIPTTGTALTRSADVASITGSNFSSWYNQSEGTIMIQSKSLDTVTNSQAVVSFGYADDLLRSSTSLGVRWSAGSGNSVVSNVSANPFKLAAAYVDGTELRSAGNGVLGTLDTSLNPKTNTSLSFGGQIGSGGSTNHSGTHSRLTYFPDRLEDSVLQAITQ